MPTPTPCPSRCVTRASTSWPIRARTATTVSARGAHTSGRRSRTTPPNSVAGASPVEHGPFMWARHAQAREIEVIDDGDIARWTAEHDGYASLDPPAVHRRSVLLDRASRSIDIIDEIAGRQPGRPSYLPLRPRDPGGTRWIMGSPELAARGHARSGAAATARRAPVEPAPGRNRSHPRLVLSRPGTPRSRLHPPRQRAQRIWRTTSHTAGVRRDRCPVETCPIMVRIRRAGDRGA